MKIFSSIIPVIIAIQHIGFSYLISTIYGPAIERNILDINDSEDTNIHLD